MSRPGFASLADLGWQVTVTEGHEGSVAHLIRLWLVPDKSYAQTTVQPRNG
jgi:hypothetical protein